MECVDGSNKYPKRKTLIDNWQLLIIMKDEVVVGIISFNHENSHFTSDLRSDMKHNYTHSIIILIE